MMTKMEFIFPEADKINPVCHVETVEDVFDAAGEPLSGGRKHRGALEITGANIDAMKLTEAEKTSVLAILIEAKDGRSVWTPPES
jgi:hypothetical protein|tara:strand:+ start:395 stop:649 length:255 start_codon:yes stop_codon:yes gene_type:complete